MRLLEPLVLRGATAPNRVLFGPHETNLGWDRSISERHLAYYERRARGGAGIIVCEEASVHESDWPYERCPLAAECEPGWRGLAARVHAHGGLAIAAIGHTGGQGASAYSQRELWAPSGVPEVNTREVPKVMEDADIAAVVRGFGAATELAVRAGLDGVEVNAGQNSLVRQFLSGLTNTRADGYGADRSRFAREVLHSVRAAAGEALVGLRLSCDELAPWAGIVPEAAVELAVSFLPWIDYLVVVRGAIFSVPATRPDGHTPPGFNLDLAAAVRDAVGGRVPVVAQGSIVDWGQAEWAVGEGARADGVEMTRAQIADPDLVAKLRAGDADRIRPCILCNQTCKVRDNRNPIVSCVVEPAAGHETEDPPTEGRAAHPQRVLVVGGGVAGLECARVAASRGHDVTVWEQSHQLGGAVRDAAAAAGRERLTVVADWLVAETARLGVHVELDRPARVTAADAMRGATDPFAGQGYDHVVLATGSLTGPATYKVTKTAVVADARTVLAAVRAGDPDGGLPSGPVAVWDPIGGPIGVSIAETLVAAGREVALVTPDLIVGTLLSRSGDLAPANTRLESAGVTLRKRSILRTVKKNAYVVEDRFSGELTEHKAAAVVDAGARLPDERLWESTGHHHVRAGDCVAPRTIYEAVLEGRRAALTVEGEV
ncbi:MAG: mycofactocin system FadH/OYE family oxidoreductase 1 [Acidimicrobiales bacterium]